MLDKTWYSRSINLISFLLFPISFIFSKIAQRRKTKQLLEQYKSHIPVIIVGNISVGGTGKTPVVRKLAEQYLVQGKKVAIISRGYGAKSENYPFVVSVNTKPSECGDEPAMLYDAMRGEVPIVIGPKRVESVKLIEKKYPDTDVIISDDGLQHYKLGRDYEYCVVDATRMFGNQLCIPAGPLREPVERLKQVDQVVVIGELEGSDKDFLKSYNQKITQTKIKSLEFVNLLSKETLAIDNFYGKSVTAVAGIGNPDKFFTSLDGLGINIHHEKIFKDHHKYEEKDFSDIEVDDRVIMTYKDAIKCKDFANDNWWYLDIDLDVSNFLNCE
ncbi:tetraacyldisaccharide 4'-kinase [Francisella adeliensis]|uniref:Tetraacyldisaccharide 4'-kinase n=1 Tax=Francisella adeliensis TaxID=2007306 RepID=A0A2Z4Y0E3_9GAMM|nr:tetraacyldisaccharide 4'-kinase [Francisella adeliensis]AXA34449.1 tetraacyldisaccharide 4'-kinase [Francisella adeliensis]MBK2086556.1 tetraacyldisaccharide 4'-kinase [Francisella adeliensis]MBK2096385.1 tetraacyldisaccharide 4'-kinase [Francisella adeliensis]QIW12696.1 tetraacyldisaccharide 4'-kinase [Francisella adeliensis]QIW14572.1 tetraacyldisaccharide 4'-kinase [Francisella adeliensis]